jgi:hypothetical protein
LPPGDLVGAAVHDQERRGELFGVRPDSLDPIDHGARGARRARRARRAVALRDQRIAIHLGHDPRVAGELRMRCREHRGAGRPRGGERRGCGSAAAAAMGCLADRSPLAAAACRVIDGITMWYLGSVPHQPDVAAEALADVANAPNVGDALASAATE